MARLRSNPLRAHRGLTTPTLPLTLTLTLTLTRTRTLSLTLNPNQVRTEDYPIMPAEHVSFALKPCGF